MCNKRWDFNIRYIWTFSVQFWSLSKIIWFITGSYNYRRCEKCMKGWYVVYRGDNYTNMKRAVCSPQGRRQLRENQREDERLEKCRKGFSNQSMVQWWKTRSICGRPEFNSPGKHTFSWGALSEDGEVIMRAARVRLTDIWNNFFYGTRRGAVKLRWAGGR